MTAQHVDDNGQHIEKLDRRLRELSVKFASLGDTRDIEEILQIIRKPGWTSQRDVFFVNTLLDVVQQTGLDAAHQRAALRDGVLRIAEDTAS
jgi:predicted DsbA family dithiol-disulfide isomerase